MMKFSIRVKLELFYSSEVVARNSGEATAIGRWAPQTATDRNSCPAIPTSVRFEMPIAASGRATMPSLPRLNSMRLRSRIDPGRGHGFSGPGHLWCRQIRIPGLARLGAHRREGRLRVAISSLDHSKCSSSSGQGPRSRPIIESGSTGNWSYLLIVVTLWFRPFFLK